MEWEGDPSLITADGKSNENTYYGQVPKATQKRKKGLGYPIIQQFWSI